MKDPFSSVVYKHDYTRHEFHKVHLKSSIPGITLVVWEPPWWDVFAWAYYFLYRVFASKERSTGWIVMTHASGLQLTVRVLAKKIRS